MSQNWYFKNMDKNEYVTGAGNGNFNDTLRDSKFIVWVMMEKWSNAVIKCFPEHKMPEPEGCYGCILKATNKTEEYSEEYISGQDPDYGE